MKHTDDLNQDDVLLQKLTQIVLDNLENEQFSVEDLSEQIGISRSHLYRKIKLLRGQSISQFVRQIRLERAMEMLENNVATASEIAYRVGFSSPSYFNKCFNEHFGYTPGEVRRKSISDDLTPTIPATAVEMETSSASEKPAKDTNRISNNRLRKVQQGLTSYFEGNAKLQIAALKTKMLALNQDLPEVHFVLGGTACWVEWDYERAERELKRAIEINPNASAARAYLSHVLNIRHKPAEAMEQIEIALELDPFNPLFKALYGMDMLYARQFDKAIRVLTQTLEKAPTDPVALSTLRTAYHMKKMYPEALGIWQTSYAAKEDQEAVATLLRGNQEGGYERALEALAELLIERSKTTYVTPWQIATLYTRAGKKEAALQWLEKAFEAHDSNMPYIGVDPIFDIFRNDPRFQELLKRMNLPLSEHPLANS